jgi:hypothetical protein
VVSVVRTGGHDVNRLLAPDPGHAIAPGRRPTFSVVIPAYQASAHIARALESVLEQTVPPLEIIVSDDGSTDDLVGAVEPYRDRITFISGPNGGPPAARNRGFRAAEGDFVVNLDADDVLYPRWIEAVGRCAERRPDLDIITTNGYRVRDGRPVRRWYEDDWAFAVEDQRREILRRSFIIGFAAVRRTRFLEAGGFDEEIVSAWDFWLRLLLGGARAGCVDEPLFEYTAREGSLSTMRGSRPEATIRVLEKALSMNLSPEERDEVASTVAAARLHWERDALHLALVAGDGGARRRALRLALTRGHGFLPRIKMLAAVVAPRLAGRVVRAIDRLQTERLQRDLDRPSPTISRV